MGVDLIKRGIKILNIKKNFYLIFLAFAILFLIVVLKLYILHKNNIETSGTLKCHDCNVILITPTNIGAKHMSLYGYTRQTTPNIDKFSKDSIVFTNAFSPISWSLPAVASLFTSEYPFTHGLMGRQVLDPDEITLAEILKLYNYTTVAFTGGGDYRTIYGISQGFDIFDDDNSSIIFTGSFNRTTKAALEWLENNKNKKFFMFVQGYDAHCPFDPPQEYRTLFEHNYRGTLNDSLCIRSASIPYNIDSDTNNATLSAFYFANMTLSPKYAVLTQMNLTNKDVKHLRSMYDSEVRYVDDTLSKFLNSISQLSISSKTILIIVGDHGDMFGRHGRLTRLGSVRGSLYDKIIRIPLIIKHPSIKQGKKIDSLVETIDIMPTVLDLLGIPENHQVQGLSLIPLLNGSKDELREYVFSGGYFGPGRLFGYIATNDAIRSKHWKLIFERSNDGKIINLELYDIEKDPDESTNLIAQEPENAMQLKEYLQKWEQYTTKQRNLKKVTLSDTELRAAIQAGYPS